MVRSTARPAQGALGVLAVLALCLVAVALPAQANEAGLYGIHNPSTPTPTTWYLHLAGGLMDMPISPQVPSDNWTSSPPGFGLGATSTSCVPTLPMTTVVGQSYATAYGYSSAGLIDYGRIEGGYPRIMRPMAPLAYDLELDPAKPLVLHWFVEPQASLPVTLVPNVVVEATLRAGPSPEAFGKPLDQGSGAILGHGKSAPQLMAPGSPGQSTGPDGHALYEVAVPIEMQVPTIPSETGFVLRIDTYVDNPACAGGEGGYLAPAFTYLSDPQHRPRIDAVELNPLRIEYVHPQFVGDVLVVHTSYSTPWGAAGLDAAHADTIHFDGPTHAVAVERFQYLRTHEYSTHVLPLDATWVWNYTSDQAALGHYTADYAVASQGGAQATSRVAFDLGKGLVTRCGQPNPAGQANASLGPEAMGCSEATQADGMRAVAPGAGWAMATVALGLAAAGSRRRRP